MLQFSEIQNIALKLFLNHPRTILSVEAVVSSSKNPPMLHEHI